MRRIPLSVFTVALVALVAAGCSDSDDATTTSSPSTAATTTTTAAGDDGDGASTSTTTLGVGSTIPSTGDDGGTGGIPDFFFEPMTIELDDGTEITFSQKFWATFSTEGTVVVVRDGVTLVDTPLFGDESAMSQEPDGTYLFVDDGGEIVARLTQEELLEAYQAELDEAGIS